MKQLIHSRFPKTVGLVLALSVGMVACGTTSTPAPVVQPNVTVTLVGANSLPLVVGGTAKVNFTVTATGGASSDVTFTSNNTNVVTVDADGNITAVAPGTATITVASKTDTDADARAVLTVVVSAATPAVDVKFSFRPTGPAPVAPPALPADYTADNGLGYDATRMYGWVTEASLSGTREPVDVSGRARARSGPTDDVLKTYIIMAPVAGATYTEMRRAAWEHAVPNGSYSVTVSVGDNEFFDSSHTVNVEGTAAINQFVPTNANPFRSATVNVNVTDGALTLDSIGGTNTKINYVTIKSNTASALGQ